jgi:hypothetical protein
MLMLGTRPATLFDALSFPTFPPDDVLRDQVERAVENNLADPSVDRFIALLDKLDGDVDLEPSMGWLPEGALDETENCGDEEFALGSRDAEIDQSEWGIDLGGHLRIDIDRELDNTE